MNVMFCNSSTWSCTPAGTGFQDADTLIVSHQVSFSTTTNPCTVSASLIIVEATGTMRFTGAGKLIMSNPAGRIVVKAGGKIEAVGTNPGTLIQIGNDSVWGGAAGNDSTVNGPDTLFGSGFFLPLHWLDVSVRLDGGNSTVSWLTTAEENCSHFELLRSRDGYSWEMVGKMVTLNRFEGETRYHFCDKQPLPGKSFYKVVQFDLDGRFSISPIVALQSPIGEAIFSPNPTFGSINVIYDRSWLDGKATIFDHSGRVIEVSPISVQYQSFNLGHLPPGLYMVRLENHGMVLTTPLVKQ